MKMQPTFVRGRTSDMRRPVLERDVRNHSDSLPTTSASAVSKGTRLLIAGVLLALMAIVFSSCGAYNSGAAAGPSIRFSSVPFAEAAGPDQLRAIEGRVIGAAPGQVVVLYARDSNTWWVQPFADHPFTKLQADSTWSNSTHPGSEYAALLVGPDFHPPLTTQQLPTQGVIASARRKGTPHAWQTWWFYTLCVLAGVLVILGIHALRLRQVRKSLQMRFEERLAERVRVAQELHDTLLQGVLSASMQLHVVVDTLPDESSVRPQLSRVLQVIQTVVEDSRNTLRGLRSSIDSADDLKNSLARIPQEIGAPGIDLRVVVEGTALPLRPAIRDDVYRIGREALVNALKHSGAGFIDLHLQYAPDQFRVLVQDDGCGIDSAVLQSGRDGHWGLPGMRERAGVIGGKIRVLTRSGGGTEVELCVPSNVAFDVPPSWPNLRWLSRFRQTRSETNRRA